VAADRRNALTSIHVAGRELPVRLRWNRRARRLILRLDPDEDGVVVTLPARAARADAMKLVAENTGWIEKTLARRARRVVFENGVEIPFNDIPHRVRHYPHGRFGVRRVDGEILVAGEAAHLARRVRDWLKAEARTSVSEKAYAMASCLDQHVNRISVRDTHTRWGSCSAAGNLSFCWRLVLVPDWVRDYVVAHEVAHLRHFHHGPAFWRTVDALEVDADGARDWLYHNTERLMRIG